MKLHRPLAQGIVSALREIFLQDRYADKVIQHLLKSQKKWGSRDRAFVAEQVYDMVRWYRLLCELEGLDYTEPPKQERQWYRLLGIHLSLKGFPLPGWDEFEAIDRDLFLDKKKDLEKVRAIKESIPDWLDATGSEELGDRWPDLIAALNQTADVILRANTLRADIQELQSRLLAHGWETKRSDLSPDALILSKRGNVFADPLFKQGYFEVQDAGSQCIAPFLEPAPGMRVIDACAGAGGKTLHLAALMQNKGHIIALDTEAWKLAELKKRARRNGVHIIETRYIESSKTIKRLRNTADRLLIDVPCSGLGVLRRNPDAKWKLSPSFLEKVKSIQSEILDKYSEMLRPGGKMVYATCSILPSENEHQVRSFLHSHESFKLSREQKLSPDQTEGDGFYMALLNH